jgi:hypothetical protein
MTRFRVHNSFTALNGFNKARKICNETKLSNLTFTDSPKFMKLILHKIMDFQSNA